MLDWKVNFVTIYLSDVLIECDKDTKEKFEKVHTYVLKTYPTLSNQKKILIAMLLLTLLKFLQSKIVWCAKSRNKS